MVSEGKSVSIVVTEDDPDDQLLIQEAFRKADISDSLIVANDGAELMEYLDDHRGSASSHRPDLILLDLNMPRMGGREALSAIKSDPELRSIPVVVLTTSGDEDDILNTYSLGASSYIRKPVTFTELVEIVKHLNKYWFELVQLPPTASLQAEGVA